VLELKPETDDAVAALPEMLMLHVPDAPEPDVVGAPTLLALRVTAPVRPLTDVTPPDAGVDQDKTPEPLVVKTCVADPVLSGNVRVTSLERDAGARREITLVPCPDDSRKDT
jgi:hypothetical protein